jgi:hypothetical protein
MSKEKLVQKARECAGKVLEAKGYISPIDVLVVMERITPKQVEDWRFCRIPYLERVTNGGLSKMNSILQAIQAYAAEQRLKPSKTVYHKWGKGPKIVLRFSKSGAPYMENLYSTHYVREKRKEARGDE